jgi:hypothetical protein
MLSHFPSYASDVDIAMLEWRKASDAYIAIDTRSKAAEEQAANLDALAAVAEIEASCLRDDLRKTQKEVNRLSQTKP